MNIQELLAEKEQIRFRSEEVDSLIAAFDNGFRYFTVTRVFGSVYLKVFTNLHSYEDYCDHFYGDNGIVDSYTTDPSLVGNYDSGQHYAISENTVSKIASLGPDRVSHNSIISILKNAPEVAEYDKALAIREEEEDEKRRVESKSW